MKKELFKTLFARMLATYLTVILGLLLLMGVTVSSMFRNQYLQEQEQSLRKEGAQINTILVEKYIDENKRPVAEQDIEASARKFDALIQVIDQQGGIISRFDQEASAEKWGLLAESTKLYAQEEPLRLSMPGLDVFPADNSLLRPGSKPFLLGKPAVTVLSEQGVFYYNLFSDVTDMPTLTFIRPAINEGKPDGMILIHLDMQQVNASIRQLYMEVMLIGLLAVLIAIMVVYYLTTRISKPITQMNETVRRYSKGSFDLRLASTGADEVAQLAISFNLMAEELATLEQTRRSFVANVSHELRSPLTSISGFLEAIEDGTIPAEKQSEYIHLVIGETKRMTGMVNNLLDLARIESGQIVLRLSQFDINELARRTILTFEARINSKKLDVELALMEPYCYVEADADQIAQVLRNLIDNAIKFSPQEGRLIVRTSLKDRRAALISVQDYGSGIPKEDVAHVFKRFYKAEKAHTPSAQSGTGLGLSIAQAIIDKHGQDIWAQSEPGRGTVFAFTLKYLQDIRRKSDTGKNKDGK